MAEEFIEYFQPEDDLIQDNYDKDRVVNIYPVFMPEGLLNTEPSETLLTFPNPQPQIRTQPSPIFLPKLVEEFPVFPSKLSDQPPLFQPEYLEHTLSFIINMITMSLVC